MQVCFFNYRSIGESTDENSNTCIFDQFFDQHQSSQIVVGLACHDAAPFAYEAISTRLHYYCKKNSKKLIIVADRIYQHLAVNWPVGDLYFVDYWPMLVRRHALAKQEQYHADACQALCLTGTMDRINRIGMLAVFFKREQLDQVRYSWLMPDSDLNLTRYNASKDICDQIGVNYQQLEAVSKHAEINETPHAVLNLLESDKIYKFKEKQFNLDPIHWRKTKFSLVTETIFNSRNHFCITEKTWMAVYNRHPLLIINHPGANQWINQQGIVTVDKLVAPEFDNMCLDWAKLNLCADITMDLLNTQYYDQQLLQIAEQNFLVMQRICEYSEQTLTGLAQSLNLALESIQEQLLEPWLQETTWKNHNVFVSGAGQLWNNFYNNIKDPSWPDCSSQHDFEKLPVLIQQEILNSHNAF